MENQGFILGPMTVKAVNKNDSIILPESLEKFMNFAGSIGLDLREVPITFDSGFDSRDNKENVKSYGLVPVIYPNRRNIKKPILIAQKFRWLKYEIYKERFAVERTFGWQDVYRKLALSYDRLLAIRMGFRYLGYSMVNFRVTFHKKT